MTDWQVKKVVVVDGEFDDGLARRLRDQGYEPMVIQRGAQAVKAGL